MEARAKIWTDGIAGFQRTAQLENFADAAGVSFPGVIDGVQE
jgi:hypothetical protein